MLERPHDVDERLDLFADEAEFSHDVEDISAPEPTLHLLPIAVVEQVPDAIGGFRGGDPCEERIDEPDVRESELQTIPQHHLEGKLLSVHPDGLDRGERAEPLRDERFVVEQPDVE